MPSFDALPPRPGGAIDWTRLEAEFDWLRALADCPQDPLFHAEGDVLIHTRMVAEALVSGAGYAAADMQGRRALFWTALLHDVAKPATTQTNPDGRIVAPGHPRRGAIMARSILWRLGAPAAERERICGLVAHHQAPPRLIERDAPDRRAAEISWRVRCDRLADFAEADIAGRVCAEPDRARNRDNIALFREQCRELGCLDRPRRFASDHTRLLYFRGGERAPEIEAYDDTRSEAALLSGLPASGKDTWTRANAGDAVVVSLDALRLELGVKPSDPQGAVIQAAREKAREALRRGAPLIWNATNLSRQLRGGIIDLFTDYKARIRIVSFETSEPELRRRNAARENPVPDKAIARMLERWEAPDLTECHALEIVES